MRVVLAAMAIVLTLTSCKGQNPTEGGYQFRIGQAIYWVGETPPPPQGRWEPTGKSETGEPMWKRVVKPEDR